MAIELPIKKKVMISLQGHQNESLSRQEIVDLVVHKFPNTHRGSVIPSDYCYNRYNRGIAFDFHILEWAERGKYKVIGIGYKYTGPIMWKGNQIGEWRDGVKTISIKI